MRDIPGTLEEALRIASQQETVEVAQKRLHKEKHLTAETLALEITKVIVRTQKRWL